jgi:hypothetical protein
LGHLASISTDFVPGRAVFPKPGAAERPQEILFFFYCTFKVAQLYNIKPIFIPGQFELITNFKYF